MNAVSKFITLLIIVVCSNSFAASDPDLCSNLLLIKNIKSDQILFTQQGPNWVDLEFKANWMTEIQSSQKPIDLDFLNQKNVREFAREVGFASLVANGTVDIFNSAKDPYQSVPKRDSYNHLRIMKILRQLNAGKTKIKATADEIERIRVVFQLGPDLKI